MRPQAFFDQDAFTGDPDWASCYCLEPHLPPTDESPEGPWRKVRAEMVSRLGNGDAYGYLAYVDNLAAAWANASQRSDYGLYRHVDPEGPGHYRGPRHLCEERGFEPVEVRERDTIMRRPAVID